MGIKNKKSGTTAANSSLQPFSYTNIQLQTLKIYVLSVVFYNILQDTTSWLIFGAKVKVFLGENVKVPKSGPIINPIKTCLLYTSPSPRDS